MLAALPDRPDHNALELEILELWERERTFERLRELNREGPRWSFVDGPVTASVGVGLFGALTDIEILAAADSAMYEAKEAGRDQCHLAQSDATSDLVQAGRGRAHSSRFQTRSA